MKQGWEYKKLGDCTQILDSQRKPVTKKDRIGGIYPYYGATGIQDYVDKYIFDGRYVLVGEDGAKWSAFEQSAFIIEGKSWVNNHAHVLKPHDLLVDTFLIYFLNYSDLDSYISGAIVRKLTQASLRNIDIPLPPKSTQLTIVSELDKINELIRLKKEQLKDYDNLAQSIFYDMFGDPVENDKGWEVKKLKDISYEIGDGLHGTPEYTDTYTGCYFINGNNLEDGVIVIKDNTKMVSTKTKTMHYIEMDDYTILISINGTLGKIAFYNGENVILRKSACYIKLNKEQNKKYIYELLKSKYFKEYAEAECTGTTIRNVSLKSMRNFPVPIPPLPLQHLFAQRIELIEHQKSEVTKAITDLETLLASRMQYWFE